MIDDRTNDRISQPPAGEDLLPPVEPPSARFLIQLFVVPALIVVVIVAVWLTFNWIVRRTATRPEHLIQGLEQGPSIARWQRASELADMLRNDRFIEFRRSGKSAAHLARILEGELASGGMHEGDVALRVFLVRALGKFETNEGIATLLKAAETQRDDAERLVRTQALWAISERAHNLQQLDPPQDLRHPDLEPTLFRLAADEDPEIRLRAVFALGKLGTPAAVERLEAMVDDPDADTRYNVAVALAHRANAKSVETLAEMLDLDELIRRQQQTTKEELASTSGVIVHTAMEAAQQLARKNPGADLSPVIESLEQLAEADRNTLEQANLPPRVASDARHALQVVRGRTAKIN